MSAPRSSSVRFRPCEECGRRLCGYFGPEWNPVLAVLAVLCALAMFSWWLGVLALAVAFVAGGIYFAVRGW